MKYVFLLSLFLFSSTGFSVRADMADFLSPAPSASTQSGWYAKQRARYFNAHAIREADRLLSMERYDLALRHLETAFAQQPQDTHLGLQLLEVYGHLGHWKKAVHLGKNLKTKLPKHDGLNLYLGLAAFEAGDYTLAVKSLEAGLGALRLHPHEAGRVYRALTLSHGNMGQGDKTIAFAEAWLEQEESTEAYNILAIEAVHTEDWPVAIETYKTLLALYADPLEKGEVHFKLGYLYGKIDDLNSAKAAFHAALELLPGRDRRAEIDRQLGQNAFRSGDFFQAADYLKASLLSRFDEDTGLAYLHALMSSDRQELAALEADALLRKEGVSDEFIGAVQQLQVGVYKALGQDQAYYDLVMQIYAVQPTRNLLLEMATAADRLGYSEESKKWYRQYMDMEAEIAP